MSPSPIAEFLAGRTPLVFRDTDFYRFLCVFVESGIMAADGVTPLQRLLVSENGGRTLHAAISEVPRGIVLTATTNAVIVPGLDNRRFLVSSEDGYQGRISLLAIDSEVTLESCPEFRLPDEFHPLPPVVPGRYVLSKGELGYWLAVEILDPHSTAERQWEHFVFPQEVSGGGNMGRRRTDDIEVVTWSSGVPSKVKLKGGAAVLLHGGPATTTSEVVFRRILRGDLYGYSFVLDRGHDEHITAILKHELPG